MKQFILKHRSAVVLVIGFLFIAVGGLYLDRAKEQDRKAEEGAVLIGSGYTNVAMMDERGTCPRGVYARWYEATNPAGEQERGLVCIVYSDDTSYIIPTYKK